MMVKKRKKDLIELDKRYIWHPFTQMKEWLSSSPTVIERAEGVYLYDIEGNKYIDGTSSIWVCACGHNHPEINSAIERQLHMVAHTTLLGLSNVPSIELAERLIKISPKNLTKVFFSDNGSTAVEIALKIAYHYFRNLGAKGDERSLFVHFTNSYHGDTIGSVSVGGIDLFHSTYKHMVFKTINVPYPYIYRRPDGMTEDEYISQCKNSFVETLDRFGKKICAVIVEPGMQGAAGMIKMPEGFLSFIRNKTKERGILLILDEVATGFMRTGKMFACQYEDVEPDLMAVAKAISGGYLPVAATLTTQKIFDAFLGEVYEAKHFFHGHTYTGNPLGCAASCAAIDILTRRDSVQKIKENIEEFQSGLARLEKLKIVGDVRQLGLMAGIELVKNKDTKEPFDQKLMVAKKVAQIAKENGLIIRPIGDVIILMPILLSPRHIIKEIVDIVETAIEDVTRQLQY